MCNGDTYYQNSDSFVFYKTSEPIKMVANTSYYMSQYFLHIRRQNKKILLLQSNNAYNHHKFFQKQALKSPRNQMVLDEYSSRNQMYLQDKVLKVLAKGELYHKTKLEGHSTYFSIDLKGQCNSVLEWLLFLWKASGPLLSRIEIPGLQGWGWEWSSTLSEEEGKGKDCVREDQQQEWH